MSIKKHIEELSSADSSVRNSAANKLVSMGTVALDEVIFLLSKGDENSRLEAAIVIGKIGEKKALEPLLKALSDSSPSVKNQVIYALGKLGDSRAYDALIDTLSNKEIIPIVAKALGDLGDQRAITPLLNVLKPLKDSDEYLDSIKKYWLSLALVQLKCFEKLVIE